MDFASFDGVSWSVAIVSAAVAADESPFSTRWSRERFSNCLASCAGECGHFIASFAVVTGVSRYCFTRCHVECLVGARGVLTLPFEYYFDYVSAAGTSGLEVCDIVLGSLTCWAASRRGWTHQFCSFRELVGSKAARLQMGSSTFHTYN